MILDDNLRRMFHYPFYVSSITLSILSLSGKIPVLSIWFIITVSGFTRTIVIAFINLTDIPSHP